MRRVAIAVSLTAALILAGCSSLMMSGGGGSYGSGSDERSSTELAKDTAITTAVKARHMDDPTVNMFEIGVRTVNGQVTLTGTVGSYAARNQAYRLARQVDGVTSVVNQIRVEDRSQ